MRKLILQLGFFLGGLIVLGNAVVFTQSPIECYIAMVFFLSTVVIGSIGEDEHSTRIEEPVRAGCRFKRHGKHSGRR